MPHVIVCPRCAKKKERSQMQGMGTPRTEAQIAEAKKRTGAIPLPDCWYLHEEWRCPKCGYVMPAEPK